MNHEELNLKRAELLLEQGRVKDAVKEVEQVLQANPNNDHALSVYARCMIQQGNFNKALEVLNNALSVNPEEDYYFYLKGFVHYKNDVNLSALSELDKAIQLNPYHPEYFALAAFILIDEKRYDEALAKTDEALSLDPENLSGLNARSRALNKLNRTEEAIDTMKDALQAAPENELTHTTTGFNFLEKGKHRDAQKHFREALRISPGNNTAKEGFKESLKSNFAPYRLIFRLNLFIHEKGKNFRWGFIIGLYVIFRILRSVAVSNPSTRIFLVPLLVLYFLFFVFSWIGSSMANFFLLFHKDGKYILSKWENIAAILVVTLLVSGIILGSYSFLLHDNGKWVIAGVILGSLSIPASRFEGFDVIEYKSLKFIYPVSLLVIGLLAVIAGFLSISGEISAALFVLYFLGLLVFMWVANSIK
jgi:tetratricopeptide (TPR) repeat protein